MYNKYSTAINIVKGARVPNISLEVNTKCTVPYFGRMSIFYEGMYIQVHSNTENNFLIKYQLDISIGY